MSVLESAPTRKSRWRGLSAAIAIVTLAVGSVSLPSAAFADPIPSIYGIVTGEGTPLAGATVNVLSSADETTILATAETLEDGSFTFYDLPDANYKLNVSAGDAWFSEWYDNAADFAGAADVTVTPPGPTTVYVDLATTNPCGVGMPVGHINGVVVTDSDGEPLAGATVALTTSGAPVDSQVTGVDGTFAFDCLSTADYTFYEATVSANNLISQLTGAWLYPDEQSVDVGEVRLIAGWTVSGTVTGAGVPLEGVEVTGYDPEAFDYEPAEYTTTTAADGTFSFTHMDSDAFRIRFTGQDGFATEWWNNAPNDDTSTPIRVNKNVSLTVALDPEASISGIVTGKATSMAAALPANDVAVDLYTATGTLIDTEHTDVDGSYEFNGLLPGSYKLHFGGEPSESQWIPTWYAGKTTLGAATSVTAKGILASGKNVVLLRGASITGLVQGGDNPAEDVTVLVRKIDGTLIGQSDSGADGTYTVPGLPAGTYTVQFEPHSTWATQWWNQGLSAISSTPVVLGASATVTGINANLPEGSHIAGEVTTSSYDDTPYVDAYLYTAAGELVAQDLDTNFYEFDSVSPGDYVIKFVSPDLQYYDEYWKNRFTRLSATKITVAEGDYINNDDAVISRRSVGTAQVHGTVTDAAGDPVDGATVYLYTSKGDDGDYDYTYTDSDGTWDIEGVSAGKYTLFVEGSYSGDFAPEYWNNKVSLGTATYFTIANGQNLTNLDMSLVEGGTVEGTVTEAGSDADYGRVDVFRASDGVQVESESYFNGQYDTDAVPPGTYRLRFTPYESTTSTYGVTWSGGGRTFATATSVVVGAGDAVTSNIALATGWSTLRGKTVTSAGVPIAGVAVDVFVRDPDGIYRDRDDTTYTDGTGMYYVSNLPTGAYKLKFTDEDGVYRTEWYANKTTLAVANVLSVTALNATVTAGNAVLDLMPPKLALTTPRINGAVVTGSLLSASVQAIVPSASVARSYQWYRNGVKITGAVYSTYRLTAADAGKDIIVKVTVTRAGYVSAFKVSTPVNTLETTS